MDDGAPDQPRSLTRHPHWIDGREQPPADGRYLSTLDPRTRRAGDEVAAGSAADVRRAVAVAAAAAPAWAALPAAGRGAVLLRLAEEIDADAERLMELERRCTGKTEQQLRLETSMSAEYFRYYAGVVRALSGRTVDLGAGSTTWTRLEPFGVVGVVTPWNLPLNQAARAVAPALAVGNAVVVKPSEHTAGTTVHLGRLAARAGLPDGVLGVVNGTGEEVGAALVADERVRKVSFTGSVETGRRVAATAAQRLVPLTLELGGKSPSIVFADADLDAAAAAAVSALSFNAGQVCSAHTRLLVQEEVHDDVVDRVVAAARRLRPGTDFGPMITQLQYEKVLEHFEEAARAGLTAAVGGAPYAEGPGTEGFYVPPTVYARAPREARVVREEVFGPVLVTASFRDEEQAVGLADDTEFGLVAGVWSGDLARGLRVAGRLRAGQVSVNGGPLTVETPFGGYGASGYGREKGLEALHDYAQVKAISASLT